MPTLAPCRNKNWSVLNRIGLMVPVDYNITSCHVRIVITSELSLHGLILID